MCVVGSRDGDLDHTIPYQPQTGVSGAFLGHSAVLDKELPPNHRTPTRLRDWRLLVSSSNSILRLMAVVPSFTESLVLIKDGSGC